MRFIAVIVVVLSLCSIAVRADDDGAGLDAETLEGLTLRSIGPALLGGRISDIAVSPRDRRTWYVSAGSGGVWKTVNAGVTWAPIFDDQPSYSIGCVALDPSTPDTVWVGTGENVSGRHVGWGDGVYKSLDGGKSWKQTGLSESQHIGKIIVDPRDGNVVYVAAEGALWSAGGERGLYKSSDGGESWARVLEIDEHTGVTDLEIDPRNPDVLYAAAYQRRRHVWSHLAGGPGSGIYKSTDAGASWRKIESGLPSGDMGKIGLTVSPADPDVVYATIEAEEKERGFYRSRDRGESWEKRDSYISNGTGPHYYQEIEASPHDVDTVYQMDVFIHVTRDGGASFKVLGDGRQKHSDNHALVLDADDAKHLLVGTDAGVYESFDDGVTWRQFPNLPISQFYKMALDDAEPFYNILGGAQDLGTLLGPSRTTHTEGVRNQDWYVPLGADGYSCAFDPDEPDLMYMEWQVGNLQRYDRRSHELLDVKPMPAPGDPPERFNWDAPLQISPHSGSRLYFGSQRLWRSDDRGNSWRPISGDLTRNRNRYELEMIGRVWSVDALYDNGAMSQYSTTTAISESPLVEGLIYVGSDDGLISVTEDGGASWRRIDALPDVPADAFVNDIEASLHDADTVYVVLDAHKNGEFSPYVFESNDRGKRWRSIASDLPAGTILWSIEQDHVESKLLFLGTEFGISFSPDGGKRWLPLGGGVPTISFRDIELQRRENDLVGATFGRGFYVLDDYSSLRAIASGALERPAVLFGVRDAWSYVPLAPSQAKGQPSLGSDAFATPNPPFGALFTYFLKESPKSAKEARRDDEKALRDAGDNVPFPGWERLATEALEHGPQVLLTVLDAEGRTVRRLTGPAKQGLHRVNWDLRLPPADPVDLTVPEFRPPWAGDPQGPLAPPGSYRVEMALLTTEGVTSLGTPQSFEVKPVPGSVLPPPDYARVASFQQRTRELMRRAQGAADEIRRTDDRIRHLRQALIDTPAAVPELAAELDGIVASLADIRLRLMGDRVRSGLNQASAPSVLGRVGQIASGHWETRQSPTATMRTSLDVAGTEFDSVRGELSKLLTTTLPAFEARLEAAGAPWTPGRALAP